jgi:hypothetical protein
MISWQASTKNYIVVSNFYEALTHLDDEWLLDMRSFNHWTFILKVRLVKIPSSTSWTTWLSLTIWDGFLCLKWHSLEIGSNSYSWKCRREILKPVSQAHSASHSNCYLTRVQIICYTSGFDYRITRWKQSFLLFLRVAKPMDTKCSYITDAGMTPREAFLPRLSTMSL